MGTITMTRELDYYAILRGAVMANGCEVLSSVETNDRITAKVKSGSQVVSITLGYYTLSMGGAEVNRTLKYVIKQALETQTGDSV